MTTFRALPVAQGDAFLLTTSHAQAYLVDGGRRRAGVPSIPSQLRASGITDLNAAIVTHTDRDHVEGIEDLLLDRFPVSEYWVPANWLDTVHTARLFQGNWSAWIDTVREILSRREPWTFDADSPRRRRVENDAPRDDDRTLNADLVLGGIAMSALALATTKLEESTTSEALNYRRNQLLMRAAEILRRGEQVKDDLRLHFERFEFSIEEETPWRPEWYPYLPAAFTLSRVATAAVEGIYSDSAELTRTLATIGRTSAALAEQRLYRRRRRPWIRFFDYSGAVVDHVVAGHPLICVNGVEVTEPIAMPSVTAYEMVALVARTASLSRVNRESRVFRFDDGASEVLFCGDSGLAFVNQPITLERPAVVTAPHHGAIANARAYSLVTGRRLTWVRSDQQNSTKRPCGNYVALPRKYCTTCGGPPTCVELVFDRAGRDWKTDAPLCRCRPRAATSTMPSWRLPITP